MKDPNMYSADWDPDRFKETQELARYYDSLTEEEWVARHEAYNSDETAAIQGCFNRDSGAPGNFLPGWDEKRVQAVIRHYESQTEDEAVAEDEATRAAGLTDLPEYYAELGLAPRPSSTNCRQKSANHAASDYLSG